MRHLFSRLCTTTAAVLLIGASPILAADPADGAKAGNAKTTEARPKPRKPGQTEALTKAIAELNKEYKEFLAKPDTTILRTSSDYFKGTLPEDTTVEDILAAINSNMQGPPAQVAYVKWQLLSAVGGKFESSQAKQAYSALQKAPRPVPAFASSPEVRSKLDQAVRNVKTNEVPSELLDGFRKEQRKIDDLNIPINGYRQALVQRLPSGLDAYLAAFESLVMRLDAGVEAGELRKQIGAMGGEIRTWATVDAKDGELDQMRSVISKLKAYQSPLVAYTPNLNSKPDAQAKWAVYPTGFGKLLDELETSLSNITTSGGGLKFRDDKDPKKK